MNKLTLLLCAVVVVTSGCIETTLNPSDKVSVTGKALNQDKTAIANTELKLTRASNSACLLMESFSKPKTDGSGGYSLELTGADTQNGNLARCFTLAVPQQQNGANASVNFLMQVTKVDVPDVQVWNGAPKATATATGAQLEFTDLASTHNINGSTFIAIVKNADGEIWEKSDAASPVAFSDAALEDFTATAYATTSHTVKGSGTTFTQTFQSDSVSVPSHNKVPASRGATCAYTNAPALCPLTDGKVTPVVFQTSQGQSVSQITLTLPAAKMLKTAVLRNLSVLGAASLELGTSVDGVTFTKVADVQVLGRYQELSLSPGSAAVTQIRLTGTASSGQTLQITGLDELSLFE
ncbi:MAG: hypothetical protein QM723_20145 [Myxococcaceae bacterium]